MNLLFHVIFHENNITKMVDNIRDNTKITKIEFIHKPKSEIIFPLEILFKNFNVTSRCCLPSSIQANLGKCLPFVLSYKRQIWQQKPYFSLKDIKKYQDKIKKEKSVSLIMLDGKKEQPFSTLIPKEKLL